MATPSLRIQDLVLWPTFHRYDNPMPNPSRHSGNMGKMRGNLNLYDRRVSVVRTPIERQEAWLPIRNPRYCIPRRAQHSPNILLLNHGPTDSMILDLNRSSDGVPRLSERGNRTLRVMTEPRPIGRTVRVRDACTFERYASDGSSRDASQGYDPLCQHTGTGFYAMRSGKICEKH